MKIVVISPEADEPRETAVMAGLFAAGLERYHVRKPGWSVARLEAWLRGLPADWRPRLVLHQHHDLSASLGLGGRHWRDEGSDGVPPAPRIEIGAPGSGFTSRSCHDLPGLRAALGRYDSVFFSPVFPSISKPGYGPRIDFSPQELTSFLQHRTVAERRPSILALGGINAETAPQALDMGFDGVAVLGAIWQAHDPVRAYERIACSFPRPAETPVMCLTQDGLSLTHAEQAARLCAAGARWIQLRMKQATDAVWLETAKEVVAVCRKHRALCIINDRVDIAVAAGADGVHLGQQDLEWREARRRLGSKFILGGTVNHAADAARAQAVGCLDYVGVGPLRFTANKQKLAPILGLDGVRELIGQLEGLPAWVIGGVETDDLPDVRAAGAAGVAVSSALFRDGRVEENFRCLMAAWSGAQLPTRVATLNALSA